MLRLDSQRLTPRAPQGGVAGGTNKSHGAGSKSLEGLADWRLKATRVSELTLQAGHEMQQEQTARVEAFHQHQSQRPLTMARAAFPDAPDNAPQVGVVKMDGGRIRTRDENLTHPHWREFQADCVVRLQSEASEEDPRPVDRGQKFLGCF